MGKRRDSTELQELSDSDGEDEHASLLFSDDDDEFDFNYDEEMEQASEEPLVRRRRRFDDEPGEKSLLELVAPLVLAHPLALFPALASVPNDFLPAGVALFVPLFCVVALLSACAHIVIVYLAWYLKVRSFEDVFAACAGERFGRFGLGVGRAFVIVSTMASTVGFIDSAGGTYCADRSAVSVAGTGRKDVPASWGPAVASPLDAASECYGERRGIH